jgi:murein DD-endopeptidase MepM/ murein hydrolase activator NlpD
MITQHAVLYGFASFVGISAVWRIFLGALRLRKLRTAGSAHDQRPDRLRAALSLALPCAAAFATLSMLAPLTGIPHPSGRVVVVLGTAILLAGAANAFLLWVTPTDRKAWVGTYGVRSLELAAATAMIVLAVWLRAVPSGAVDLDWPTEGRWTVVSGGRLKTMNHHWENPVQQNYALDMISADSSVSTLGSAVFAPADGVVVRAIAGCPEPVPCEAEGNHVVIRTREGVDVWLGHLKEGTVTAKEGDAVAVGQQIGECGATGSADEPHLHIHAERDGAAVPMRFGPRQRWLVRSDDFHSEE